MQARVLKRIGIRSALAALWVLAGGAALAQTPSGGAPGDGGGSETSSASKFSEMKVSIDAQSRRLIEVVPPLMKSIGAEFTIDADVKGAILSGHLTNVKLETALDLLMRVSDIPVQYKFEKGVYHFSTRTEPLPEPTHAAPKSTAPVLPTDPVLPPLPAQVQEDIDIHNVQTYDLLRVLNGLFNVPIEIIPSDPNGGTHGNPTGYGNSNASYTGFTNTHGFGTDGHGFSSNGGSTILGDPNSGVRNHNGSGTMTIFGHPIHFGG